MHIHPMGLLRIVIIHRGTRVSRENSYSPVCSRNLQFITQLRETQVMKLKSLTCHFGNKI